jgi:hypothetical protein
MSLHDFWCGQLLLKLRAGKLSIICLHVNGLLIYRNNQILSYLKPMATLKLTTIKSDTPDKSISQISTINSSTLSIYWWFLRHGGWPYSTEVTALTMSFSSVSSFSSLMFLAICTRLDILLKFTFLSAHHKLHHAVGYAFSWNQTESSTTFISVCRRITGNSFQWRSHSVVVITLGDNVYAKSQAQHHRSRSICSFCNFGRMWFYHLPDNKTFPSCNSYA